MNARIALALAGLAGLATFTTGCMYSTESGEITGRMVSGWEATTESPDASWQGEPIMVHAEMGDVRVVGVEGQTNIVLRANFVAGANSQEEAQPAYEDVAASMKVELVDGVWRVLCPHARERHGDVVPSTTGCEAMTVHVPAGAAARPVALSASTNFGGATAEELVVSKLSLRAPFGVLAQADPVPGADIEVYNEDLVSGDCPAELYLPSDFAADSYELSIQHPGLTRADGSTLRIDTSDFPDLTSPTGSRGQYGAGARRIHVRASIGDVVLGTGPLPEIDGPSNCQDLELEL